MAGAPEIISIRTETTQSPSTNEITIWIIKTVIP